MKRKNFAINLIGGVAMLLFLCTITGCSVRQKIAEDISMKQKEIQELKLNQSYELVSAKVNSQKQIIGNISGAYILMLGGISGNIEETENKTYDYWCKRSDGGIIAKSINMESYNYPNNVRIVIYENNSIKPKVEIWRNNSAKKWGDGVYPQSRTEFRFTIPEGAFINMYDFQGITEESQ